MSENALAIITGCQPVITKEEAEQIKLFTDFSFDGTKKVWSKLDATHILRSERYDDININERLRISVSRFCQSYEDGAARVRIGRGREGLYRETKSVGGNLLYEVFFVIYAYKRLNVICATCTPDEFKARFVTDPSSLTEAHDYSVQVQKPDEDNPGDVYWTYGSMRAGQTKRVPFTQLVQEHWFFDPKNYTRAAFPALDKVGATVIRLRAQRRSDWYGGHVLISNGKGDLLHADRHLLRQVKPDSAHKTQSVTALLKRSSGQVEEVTVTKGDYSNLDPVFTSYILAEHV